MLMWENADLSGFSRPDRSEKSSVPSCGEQSTTVRVKGEELKWKEELEKTAFGFVKYRHVELSIFS